MPVYFFCSHLSTGLDTLHETKEDDSPGEEQAERKLPAEPSEVTELLQPVREVEHVLLPELGGRGLDVCAVLRDAVLRVAPVQSEEALVRQVGGHHHAVGVRAPPFGWKRGT